MAERINIDIESRISDKSGDTDVIAESIQGFLEQKGELFKICYVKENCDCRYDGEIIFKRSEPFRIRVRRRGDISSDMLFEEGREHISDYCTGGLSFPISVRTERIVYTETDRSQIEISYIMSASDEESRVDFKIAFSEVSNAPE